jgi:hypothetical protein
MAVFQRECDLLRIELTRTHLIVVLNPREARQVLKLAITDREASQRLQAALATIWYGASCGIAIPCATE